MKIVFDFHGGNWRRQAIENNGGVVVLKGDAMKYQKSWDLGIGTHFVLCCGFGSGLLRTELGEEFG